MALSAYQNGRMVRAKIKKTIEVILHIDSQEHQRQKGGANTEVNSINFKKVWSETNKNKVHIYKHRNWEEYKEEEIVIIDSSN